jgi:hypothetical protein
MATSGEHPNLQAIVGERYVDAEPLACPPYLD